MAIISVSTTLCMEAKSFELIMVTNSVPASGRFFLHPLYLLTVISLTAVALEPWKII